MAVAILRTIWVLTALCACASPKAPSAAGGTDAGAANNFEVGAETTANSDADGGAAPVPVEAFFEAYFAAWCAKLPDCPPVLPFAVPQSCLALMTLDFDNMQSKPAKRVAAVKAGKVAYDPSAAAACIHKMATECDAGGPQAPSHPCAMVFKGTALNGTPCHADIECSSRVCKRINPESSCPGVCVPPLPKGASCSEYNECDVTLSCIGGTCHQEVGVSVGAPCHSYSCVAGLYCKSQKSGPAVCVKREVHGGSCFKADQCADGLYCNTVKPGTWGKCANQSALGQSCPLAAAVTVDTGYGYSESPCLGRPICAATSAVVGVCTALSKLGQACSGPEQCFGLDTHCGDIKVGKGICKLLPAQGETCAPSTEGFGLEFRCLGACRSIPTRS